MNVEALVGKVLGTCTLQSVIGRGETGTVFLAQQSRPRRQVAVKVLQSTLPVAPRQRATVLERIRHEIDIIASLEHPNIIQIHEYGEHHGLAYLVMPHIKGGTLHQEIENKGPLPLEKIVFYLEQIAAALDYAHKRNILHYSLKPTNILIQRGDRLLLTDFGQLKGRNIAHPRPGRNSKATSPLIYAAPEQVVSDEIDSRANLYSLGVILYLMVTGTVPFKNGRAAHHQFIRAQSPHVFRPDLPAPAVQVMLKALAAQPADRYQHVHEFSGAFREALIEAGISLADLSSMFISAGLSDPHIPVPQSSLEIQQQLPRSAARQHFPGFEQRPQPLEPQQESNVLIDTSPTLHLMKKTLLQQQDTDFVSTDAYPTIHNVKKTTLHQCVDAHRSTDAYSSVHTGNKPTRASSATHALVDTSPAIQHIRKDMLTSDQDRNGSAIDIPSTTRTTPQYGHQNDIVARTRLTLPSLTSFLLPFSGQSSAQVAHPPLLPYTGAQMADPLPNKPEPLQAATATSEPILSAAAPLHAVPALLPEAADKEQAATIPPHHRPVTYGLAKHLAQQTAAPGEQDTTTPLRNRIACVVHAPAKRTSLLFLASIVLLVTLVLGTFAYLTSAPTPTPKADLAPTHHSTRYITTRPATTTFAKPGSMSFRIEKFLLLTIKGQHSNVSIHGGDVNTATVTASIPGSGQQPLRQNNETIQYTQSVDKQGRDHLDITTASLTAEVDYIVTVPAATQIRIQVAAGSITAAGINDVSISTGGGNLSIADIHGTVDISTESGDIMADDINGQMQMRSVNGSISANNLNGQLHAITQNGDVTVKGAMLNSQSTLQTTNGSIRFAGTLEPQGSYQMTTTRGNITLTLPVHAAIQLDASTHSGYISNAFGASISGPAPRALITLTIQDGGSITINIGAA
jgi:serine/threonine protein kinase